MGTIAVEKSLLEDTKGTMRAHHGYDAIEKSFFEGNHGHDVVAPWV
ncbi:MAG: hypothetical protein IPN38_16740 [Flavobacteriales bacterium]|nr:hypothetical protein [Flavobacteriales bacterium]